MKVETLERVKELINIAKVNNIFNLTTRDFSEFESEVLEYCEDNLSSDIVNSLEHYCEYMEYDLLSRNAKNCSAIVEGYKAAIRDVEKLIEQ